MTVVSISWLIAIAQGYQCSVENLQPSYTRMHAHIHTVTGHVCSLLTYRYSQKRLPSDDFYHPVPIFKISKLRSSSFSDSMYDEVMYANNVQYQCTITMPTSCPLLDPIIVSWLMAMILVLLLCVVSLHCVCMCVCVCHSIVYI